MIYINKQELIFVVTLLITIVICGLIIAGILSGCGQKSIIPDKCLSISGPSLICEKFKETFGADANLSEIAFGLGLGLTAAADMDYVDRQELLGIYRGLRGFVAPGGVSYSALADQIRSHKSVLTYAESYLVLLDSTQIMYTVDQELILGFLDRNIRALEAGQQ